MTNFERPLAADGMRAGAINRVLDVPVADGQIFKEPNKVVTILAENYGHAGRRFVEVVQGLNQEDLKRMFQDQRQRIRDAADGIAIEEKQVIPAAVILMADEIAGREIFRDDVRIDLKSLVRILKAADQIGEGERAYRYFFDQVAVHSRNFTDDADDTFADVWGKDYGETVAIIDSKLSDFAAAGNFDKTQFLDWCDARKLLVWGDGRHRQKKVTLPRTDRQVRCWVIRAGYGEEAGDDFAVQIPEELPFISHK